MNKLLDFMTRKHFWAGLAVGWAIVDLFIFQKPPVVTLVLAAYAMGLAAMDMKRDEK
jgi:hypothetical protein